MEQKIYRLDKWLSLQTVFSRKEIKNLIKNGRVKLGDSVVDTCDLKLAEGTVIQLDGQEFRLREFVYYVQNKPAGVICACKDRDKTVLDILPQSLKRPGLFPAGRLDKDTQGLLVLTNDGDFAHQLMAPKSRVPKTYRVHLSGNFDFLKIKAAVEDGMSLGNDEYSSPAEIVVLQEKPFPIVELTIYEGIYHQVKRMFAALGLKVTFLERIQIGNLALEETFPVGESRELEPLELVLLKSSK